MLGVGQPFVGEIRMFCGNFAPANWALCQGQLLAISENETLFQLIGTTYGGDGQQTFALPDLRGRLPIHKGNGFVIGEVAGVEQVTLTSQVIPPHTHGLLASTSAATVGIPTGNVVASTASNGALIYGTGAADVAMSPAAVGPVGQFLPHENRMPYLAVNFIISLFGIFPSQS